jgi:hypothetical protein
MRPTRFITFGLALLALGLAHAERATTSAPLRVTATTEDLGAIAREVGGDARAGTRAFKLAAPVIWTRP